MKHAEIRPGGLDYQMCDYGFSRLRFRGPRKVTAAPYAACVGGTATFGKFLPDPYPDRVEAAAGVTTVNLGLVNGGIAAYLSDSAVMAVCHDAAIVVMEVMGAHTLSNRLYQVHPRRNDRFLQATPLLRQMYDEVDFADFAFVRHMLAALQSHGPERFAIVVRELRRAWCARMREFVAELPAPPQLLWLVPPREDVTGDGPLFVTGDMLAEVNEGGPAILRIDIADCDPSRDGMVCGIGERGAMDEVPGPGVHAVVAEALTPLIRKAASRGLRAA